MDHQIKVNVLADSVSPTGARLTTFELYYHRFFHSELLTHRDFSRNAASSRAIPTTKLLDQVRNDPMLPVSVGKNQGGMQASTDLAEEDLDKFIHMWKNMAYSTATGVEQMQKLNAHKQIVNRPLEAFLPIRVVMSTTEKLNFYGLRAHAAAQPEFQTLAYLIKDVVDASIPDLLLDGEWHLPYVGGEDRTWVKSNYSTLQEQTNVLCMLSASRCARVTHAIGGLSAKAIEDEIQKGFDLFKMKHMSPFEHVACPWDVRDAVNKLFGSDLMRRLQAMDELTDHLSTPESRCPPWADVRNFRGWRQLRSFLEYNEMGLLK